MEETQVLLVEDDGVIALHLKNILVSLGYTVPKIIPSGEEAVELAPDINPDVILMDVYLSNRMNGVTAANKIKEKKNIPIIYLTAFSEEELLDKAKISEPYGYLVKPVQKDELHANIQMALYKNKLDQALKKNKERYEAVMSQALDSIFLVNAENKKITEANESSCRLFGYDKDEIIDLPIYDLLDKPQENIDKIIKNILENKQYYLGEIIYRTKDNTILIAEVNASVIRNDNEKMICFVNHDVTERTEMEERLRESEMRYKSLFDHSPVPFFVVDFSGVNEYITDLKEKGVSDFKLFFENHPDQYKECINRTKINDVNQAALKQYNATDKEELDKHIEDNFMNDGNQLYLNVLAGIANGANNVSGEDERCTVDGEIIYVYVKWAVTPGFEDTYERVYVSELDITERKKSEQKLQEMMVNLEESNQKLDQFANLTSHELQAPMRTVNSFTNILEKKFGDKMDDEIEEILKYISDGALYMKKIVNDLLNYSRIKTKGKMFKPTDLNTILQKVINSLQNDIKENDIEIIAEELPTLTVDDTQIIQVFQNLIDNAIKFRSPDRKPTIHIASEKSDNGWIISVQDNGVGFEEKYSVSIFNIFRRLHTQSEYPGTGTGLAVCKKIIERHKGKIWGESEPGKGTTFYFSLPEKENDNE